MYMYMYGYIAADKITIFIVVNMLTLAFHW